MVTGVVDDSKVDHRLECANKEGSCTVSMSVEDTIAALYARP